MCKVAAMFDIAGMRTKAEENFIAELARWDLPRLTSGGELEDLVHAVYDPLTSRLLGPRLVEHMVDVGACEEGSPILERIFALVEVYDLLGRQLIAELGRREGLRKRAGGTDRETV